MKTGISVFVGLGLLASALTFVACDKEQATPTASVTESGQGMPKTGPRIPSRTFKEVSGEAWCGTPPKDCIYGIIITPRYRADMGHVIDVVATANDNDIRAKFSANRTMLLDYMNMNMKDVDDVIAGTVLARSTTQPDPDGYRFILIRSTAAGDPLVAAYNFDLKS